MVTSQRVALVTELMDQVTSLIRTMHVMKAAYASTPMSTSGSTSTSTSGSTSVPSDRAAHLLLFPLVHSGPQRASALAEVLRADPSTVSRHVSGLVRDGLVERLADQSDGRASLLAITPAGRQVCESMRQQRGKLIATFLDDWGAEEVATLTSLLERFNNTVENHRVEMVERLGQAWQEVRSDHVRKKQENKTTQEEENK